MIQSRLLTLLGLLLLLLISGCQKSDPSYLEYVVIECDYGSTTNCKHENMIVRVHVQKFKETVFLNWLDSNRNPLGNDVRENCKILNRENWKCDDYETVEGVLIRVRSLFDPVGKDTLFVKIKR
jgi:hypothetical protein